MATTIKVSEPTRDRIKALGESTQQTADQVVSRALDEYERAQFWAAYRGAAEAEQAAGTTEVDEEQAAWDATLRDGLDDA
jgi:predicted transcriptional regulator